MTPTTSPRYKTKKCACGTPIDPRSVLCGPCRRKERQTPDVSDGIVETPTGREITTTSASAIRTLDDLVRVCKIDLKEWEVERWVCNKWEVGAKVGDKGGKRMQVTPLFQIKVWLKRPDAKVALVQSLNAALLADIRREVKRAPAVHRYQPNRYVPGNFLFEFAPFDLHVGKNTWAKETVVNYDIATAESLFNAALDFQLEYAMRISGGKLDRILAVFGNDVSHIDNKMQTTTGGTFMDADSRYQRIVKHVTAMHRRAVDTLKSIAPLDIVIVSGNHDEHTAYHLGNLLEAVYEHDKHVTVNNNPHMRKYYEYGVNLFGFTHGVAERVIELPLTMAREMPEAWARCSSREWHIGHLHKSEQWDAHNVAAQVQTLHSDKGIRVRRLTSMSGHDAWHTKNAYMDRRACQGFVFHKTAGFTAEVSFNIDHFSGKALRA